MTAAPTWSILVPTLGERRDLFTRLMRQLLPQTEPYSGRVRVVGWWNNGSPSLPKIRQTMVMGVTTEFLSFVDDDDMVAPYFVDEVMGALESKPDYVGFQVQCYSDGAPIAVAYHSLEFTRWRNLDGRFERDISHINPIRSSIARRADFSRTRAGGAEDRDWAAQLRRSRSLRRQVVIDRIMYHYLYSTSRSPGEGTRWRTGDVITPVDVLPVIEHPNFTWSHDA